MSRIHCEFHVRYLKQYGIFKLCLYKKFQKAARTIPRKNTQLQKQFKFRWERRIKAKNTSENIVARIITKTPHSTFTSEPTCLLTEISHLGLFNQNEGQTQDDAGSQKTLLQSLCQQRRGLKFYSLFLSAVYMASQWNAPNSVMYIRNRREKENFRGDTI